MKETNQNKNASKETAPKTQPNIMALVSYIGPLCLIPIFSKDKDEFVNFHAKQGLVLFIAEMAAWIIFSAISFLWFLGNFLGICWLILSIIGILNVLKNEKAEIPVIGKFADKIKL